MSKQSSIWLSLPFIVFLGIIVYLQYSIVHSTGYFLYPIDDPYIHMAMARHFVQDGIFGVSLAGFSASSSAPGWTLLLSMVYFIIGVHSWIPLLLNFIAGFILLVFLIFILHQATQNKIITAIIGTAFIFIIPLPALVSVGMEHLFHCLFVALLLHRTLGILIYENWHDWDEWLIVYSLLAVSFRYESLFLISMLILILLVRGAWRPAILIGFSGFGLVCLLGLIQTNLGWMFLPNSIMQKSILVYDDVSIVFRTLTRIFGQLVNTGHLFFPFLLAWVGLLYSIKDGNFLHNKKSLLCLVLIGTYLLHCSFAAIGWFYRYESYLIIIAILTFIAWYEDIAQIIKKTWFMYGNIKERLVSRSIAVIIFALILLIYSVNLTSIQEVIPGAKNLYEQQFQMGLFLEEYYENETVIANDIGAINYLADIYCLDLMGLGSMEPLQAKYLGRYRKTFLDNWAKSRNAKIAVIYADWFRGQIPESWIKMAEWFTPNKVTVANQTVSFYAIQADAAEELQQNLLEYRDELPKQVEVTLAKKVVTNGQ